MTAIGMGLVFIAILALWGMMDVMVKITSGSSQSVEAEPASSSEITSTSENELHVRSTLNNYSRLAAVTAVAIALQLKKQAEVVKKESGQNVSAWQLVRRTNILNQAANLIKRKSRGSEL